MRVPLIITFCCFLYLENFAQSQKSTNQFVNYVGLRYKDYHELGGFKKINSTAINLHYGVAHLKKENKNLLFLSKFENSNRHNDDFQLKVMDVVELPSFNENYYCVSLKGCSVNGRKDATIFALAQKEEEKYLTKVVRTWKLDRETGKVYNYPSVGVKCLNQRFNESEEMVIEDFEVRK